MLSLLRRGPKAPAASAYTAAQIAAARAALALAQQDRKAATKLLRKNGLIEADVLPAVEQHHADIAPETVSPEIPEPTAAGAAPSGVERLVIDIPVSYKDTMTERCRLIQAIWAKAGDDWQIEAIDPMASSVVIVRGRPIEPRPGLKAVPNGLKAGPTSGAAQAGHLRTLGLDLIEYRPFETTSLAARLPPLTAHIRSHIGRSLGLDPWDSRGGVELTLEFGPLGGEWGVTQIAITRYPLTGTAAKRQEIWRGIIDEVVPRISKTLWAYEDQTASEGRLVLTRTLDPLLAKIGYPDDATTTYTTIPFGIDDNQQPLSLAILEMNILLGGIPGGGKSGGLTALLAGISKLDNVAIIGLDPKQVELALWAKRFSAVVTGATDATVVLEQIVAEMEARYHWLGSKGLKKLTPAEMTSIRPLIVLVIDELAELVAAGEDVAADKVRAVLIRRLIAKGRAAGIVVIAATQKPSSDVVPTGLRDLMQLRVAYATMTSDMTDTILGKGAAQIGGAAHEIPAYLRGCCYVISESSRTPIRARTYWIPDEEVTAIADATASKRIELPWLSGFHSAPVRGAVIDLEEIELDLADLTEAAEPIEIPELDWSNSDFSATATEPSADEDPFAGEAKAKPIPDFDDDDPFDTAVKPRGQKVEFDWDA